MFKLVIQDDEGKTTVVPLIRDEITIGRKEGNTIRLTERNVSRRHARILRTNGEVHIEDLGSYNGIRVNNARIAERVSLRVSDQVQIGDYKLYLKAEGAEQVDEARTVPIERVENAPATEVMAAINATPTAQIPVVATGTAPLPVVATPSGATAIQTDAAGRPVATAAQVAALTAPAGYGRLVVVSSNFPGKEFELSQAQMIVGRTEDNQIVINHRSISRNHAKVVRDTETGRYTISDLQSSNGVRVNGQDYGKVELRRGDEVDLGHVRLRFVEAGEDFVFERDARIADIAEPRGGNRGLMAAVVLAVLVLAAAGGYFLMKRGDDSGGKTGSNSVASGSPDHVASGTDTMTASGSNATATNPSTNPNIAETSADAATATTQVAEVGSGSSGSGSGSGSDESRSPAAVSARCLKLQVDKKWSELSDCGKELAPLDKTGAAGFTKRAQAELDGQQKTEQMAQQLAQANFATAKKLLGQIQADSDAKTAAQAQYLDAAKPAVAQLHEDAVAAKAQHKCDKFEKDQQAAQKIESSLVTNWGNCELAVVAVRPPPVGSGSSGTAPPPPACDAVALKAAGETALKGGDFGGAMKQYENAYKCAPEIVTQRLVVLCACKANNAAVATKYFRNIPAALQGLLVQSCLEHNIALSP
jgi:pSer/pThr/pTyr-binding forkhead associated (FHA) protein